jgi:LmbE family N-acetylglucosaminyl deacetylase
VGRKSSRVIRGSAEIILPAAAAGLVGLYLYQPQRIDFFPKPSPVPNPPVDPDSERLFSPGTRVAVVAAHPDDPEFYIGGLLTALSGSGAKIAIVMCTDGDKGYYPSFLTNAAENRRVRQEEQLEAAAKYDAEVFFLHEPDGRLRANANVVDEIRQKLEVFQAEYVLSFDPIYPPKLQHSDHLRSAEATEKAIVSCTSVKWLMRYSTHAANFHLDITNLWEAKSDLLRIHKSQFSGNRATAVLSMVQSRARADDAAIQVPLAEGFRCTPLK